MDFEDLEKRLAEGRELNAFDAEAVETVATLLRRARNAASVIDAEGAVITNERQMPEEHPAVKIERLASAEIRGWVKDRPDLFGASAQSPSTSVSPRQKFGGFKLVDDK